MPAKPRGGDITFKHKDTANQSPEEKRKWLSSNNNGTLQGLAKKLFYFWMLRRNIKIRKCKKMLSGAARPQRSGRADVHRWKTLQEKVKDSTFSVLSTSYPPLLYQIRSHEWTLHTKGFGTSQKNPGFLCTCKKHVTVLRNLHPWRILTKVKNSTCVRTKGHRKSLLVSSSTII